MSDILDLDEIDLTGIDEHPPDESVKLYGPPGTGKTTQSGGRVGRLLRDYDYEVADVAWCTYRKALAMDTLDRFVAWGFLDETALEDLHTGSTRYINTIHAVANRCVGGLPDPVEPWHKADFCDRMGLQFWSSQPWEDTPGQLLFDTFGWMKNNCLDPYSESDVRRCPKTEDLYEQWQGSVPAAWNKWCDYKAQRDIIDFYKMLEAPIDDGTVPTTDILVIDEYHDATALMAKLCEYWMERAEIVIVAGDPNQVVNAFDGADPRFFEQVELPEVLLDTTYRVPEEHWRSATRMLAKAHDIPPVSRNSTGDVVEYNSPRFEHSDESGWVSPAPGQAAAPDVIREQTSPDVLFLTRTQMQADGVGAALEKAGYLYESQAGLNGWNTDGAAGRLHLFNALQKLSELNAAAFDSSSYGLSAYQDAEIDPDTVYFGSQEVSHILTHAHASTLDGRRADIDELCQEIERKGRVMSASDLNEHVQPEFWSRYTGGAGSVSRLNKGSLSDRDLRALAEALRRHDQPIDPDEIQTQVLTIHASKGQEASDVVVYDGVSRRIRREMRSSERTRQNEWRTWYVALTRASETLHIMRNGFEWASSIIPQDIRQLASGGAVPADD